MKEPAIADRLRKQAKTRAVKLVREDGGDGWVDASGFATRAAVDIIITITTTTTIIITAGSRLCDGVPRLLLPRDVAR